MASLHDIGIKHQTDKATYHNFMHLYEKYFNPFRNDAFNMLEIGISKCESLRVWLEYFPLANIYAIDLKDYPSLDPRNTNYNICQCDKRLSSMFSDSFFKIILDDGGHKMTQQLKSLGLLWDKVLPGGKYVVEDIHTSFRPNSEYSDFEPTTFEVLKKLEKKESPSFMCAGALVDAEKISSEIQSMEFFIRDPKNPQDSQTCVIVKKS